MTVKSLLAAKEPKHWRGLTIRVLSSTCILEKVHAVQFYPVIHGEAASCAKLARSSNTTAIAGRATDKNENSSRPSTSPCGENVLADVMEL